MQDASKVVFTVTQIATRLQISSFPRICMRIPRVKESSQPKSYSIPRSSFKITCYMKGSAKKTEFQNSLVVRAVSMPKLTHLSFS